MITNNAQIERLSKKKSGTVKNISKIIKIGWKALGDFNDLKKEMRGCLH